MHRKYENISNMYQVRLSEVKEMHINDAKEMAELKRQLDETDEPILLEMNHKLT
jgi:hypothetical protein